MLKFCASALGAPSIRLDLQNCHGELSYTGWPNCRTGIGFHQTSAIEPPAMWCVVPHRNGKENGNGQNLNHPWAQPGSDAVAGGQDHEVQYAAGKSGASKSDVKTAVKSVGNSRKKVEEKLGKK